MPTENYDIVGSYNNQRITTIDAERSVNVFEYIDPLGKKNKSLINTSGLINTLTDYGNVTQGFRAQFVFNDFEYNVVGNKVFRISTANIITQIGTIGTSEGYVGVDANTHQVIFVDGLKGYIWDTTSNVFTQITDPAFPVRPIDVCFLDGFFIVANGETNTFQLSSLNNGLIWGASSSTMTLAALSSNITITGGSTNLNYQIGTPVIFSGGALPAEIIAGTTYFVVAIISTNIIRVSATQSGTPITSVAGGSGTFTNNGQLQQGAITSHPGTIVACRTLHRRLFLFSQFFTEVWENAGLGTNLPFRRVNSSLMEYGTPAIGSVAVGFDKMFFLSQDRDGLGAVMEVIGTQPIPISTRALDFQLAQYAEDLHVSDCRAFLIKENGIIFYRMNFTLANHTFIYDVTLSDPSSEETKLWHEEEVLNGDRHPAQTHAYFNGKNYVGNYLHPIRYQVDDKTYTNAGEAIKRMRISRPIVPPGYQRIRVDRLQLDLLQGNISLANDTPQLLNLLTEIGDLILLEDDDELVLDQELHVHDPLHPYVFLSVSKDGGQSYGYTLRAPMGNIGQRTFRTVWRKLGATKRGQPFVTKIEFYDPVPFIVLGAAWAYDILPE